ncbi:MAG: biopolymer transporter ExbD [Bacteroidales bacterium]|nr:biopolymer transporter ExbD [Bacteroidales bacterium]MCM1147498.1 biopolymer transporter ExbD [Bacteroidales bacterium]MCM1206167.1 biopolymer transporter ExbD [Bacillota bacterium]MCM1510001.1 biopolymer transporter ExbD [Clostridium sp.]
MFRKKDRKVPILNTSALPDLVFTVLFFFMIVTHMRQTDVKVKVESPQGTQLQKLQKKYATAYIYVGKDKTGDIKIQFNNDIVDIGKLADRTIRQRETLPIEEQQNFTVSIKADKDIPLEIIAQVKEALREAHALKINYSATEALESNNKIN